jgi:superkiller protein 3
VRAKLVTALDFCLANAGRGEAEAQSWLLAVLAGVDGDRWRTRARRAAARGDGPALAGLVEEAEAARQAPAFLALLAAAFLRGDVQDKIKIDLLRRAQQRYPGDFWLNHDLAHALYLGVHPGSLYRAVAADELPLVEQAIGFYRVALALRPASPGVYFNLGVALNAKGDLDGAIAAYHKAIALDRKLAPAHSNLGAALQARGDLAGALAACRRALALDPKLAAAHYNLGVALQARGDLAGALAAYRRALALDPKLGPAHTNLGNALQAQGDLAGALAAYRRATELDPKLVTAHCNLGVALQAQGDVTGALAAFRRALEIDPKFAPAHYNLGVALQAQGRLDDAIREYRRALDLDPKLAQAHTNLGNALHDQGDLAGALAAFRRALALDPKLALAHYNLGIVLQDKGEVAGALAAYRRATELAPKLAPAYCALGQALLEQGRFAEARAATRRCLDLLPPHHPLRQSVPQQLRQCERLLALDEKLPALLQGEVTPASPAERLALAQVCQYKQLYAASARFSAEAFADRPRLAEDLREGHRYHAARCAARAGCGRGQDAARLNETERARWRRQAGQWLRADLVLHAKRLESGHPADRTEVQQNMRHWLSDPDLVGVRGTEALAELPAEEREGWAKLWAEAEALRKKAQGKTK